MTETYLKDGKRIEKIVSEPVIRAEIELAENANESEIRLYSDGEKLLYLIFPTHDAKIMKEILERRKLIKKEET